MKIRLALTLDVTRHRDEPQAEPEPTPERETQLDAWVADAPDRPDAPRIGFASIEKEGA